LIDFGLLASAGCRFELEGSEREGLEMEGSFNYLAISILTYSDKLREGIMEFY
jgi:hypothetical protein